MVTGCIGVVGAGVMGAGVTYLAAQAGMRVVLTDIDTEQLQSARDAIVKNIRFARLKGGADRTTARAEEILGRIEFSTSDEMLEQADFVIENATEHWETKAAIYPRIDQICRPHCIFAANTSCVSITRIAATTDRADRVIGMHFMNPVTAIETIELVRGFHTSEQTIVASTALLDRLGKTSILVNDMPGFVVNRVLMLAINEAIFVLQDQVASAEDVDRLFCECLGHRMGPLATADLIGLDTILHSLDVLYMSYADVKFRPSPLLKKLVDAGLLGQKSGRGFHSYDIN